MPRSHAKPLANQSSTAQQRVSHTLLLAPDFQQSILAELDSSRLDPFAYSPYGLQSGPRLASTHLGFNGQLKESPTGWYHLGQGHRVYNPVLIRFHSPDRLSPFGKGGLNAYAYCSGCPVGRVDPTGRYWLALLGNVVGFAMSLSFAASAVNRVAAAIVAKTPLGTATRVGNALGFWGSTLSIPARSIGLPAAVMAPMPVAVPLGSNLATVGTQVASTAGAILLSVTPAQTWMKAAAQAGQSRGRVLWEATKEASGWNLLRGQPPGQVRGRATEMPLEDIVVEPRSSTSGASVDLPEQARQIREGPETTRL